MDDTSLNMSLPGVVRIYCIYAYNTFMNLDFVAGLPVSPELRSDCLAFVDFTDIPKFSVESAKQHGLVIQTAKLKFHTSERLPLRGPYVCFVVSTAAGENFLIGSICKPYPDVKVTASPGSPGSDAAGYDFDISFSAPIAAIKCRII